MQITRNKDFEGYLTKSTAIRRILLASAAALTPSVALAADEAPERDYLPGNILVSGARDGYVVDDGSTGTKTPTPVIDVPQTVTFLTDDQLQDQSITQLNEALRFVPGVSLETGEGHRDEIFIRGQETTADFYLDGLRDDAQYYRSLYNTERVEVLKGANALIFGRGGGGGVINRVTKQARINGFEAEFDGSVDTFGAFALAGDVNATIAPNAAIRINGAYEEFNNHRDFYDGRFIGFAPTLTVDLGPATRLIASYSYDDNSQLVDRGVPSDNGGPLRGFDKTLFGDPGFNDTEVKVHIARTRLEHDFSSSLSVNATIQYADYDKAYQNVVPGGLRNDGADVAFSGYRDAQARQNWIGQANLVWQPVTGSVEHTILAGIEASSQDSVNTRANIAFADGNGGTTSSIELPLADMFAFPAITLPVVGRNRESELSVLSAYVQDQISFGEHFELIAGLRWDRFDLETRDVITNTPGDRVDEKLSPRFGLIVKPQEAVSLYASYAESFLPQAGDQFFILSPGNSAFEPEKFTNYEIGAKWAPNPQLLVTAAVFRLERTNTRAADPNNTGLTVLTGESRTEGVELSVIGEITPQWRANLGYTYMDGEIRTDSVFADAGTRLQQLPRHQITAWTRYDASDRLGFGLGVVHRSEQFTSFSNAVTLPSFTRVDAAIYFEASDAVSLQLNVENLLDEDYFPSAHGDNNIQPGVPINASLGARVKF